MKTLYNIYFISLFFLSVANAGISDIDFEKCILSCIVNLIPTTDSSPQTEKKETEEERKFSDIALEDLKQKKLIQAYYKIETEVTNVCQPFYYQKDEIQLSDTYTSISKLAVSNEKDIQEKSEGEWKEKLSLNQIELLACFSLTNHAIRDYAEDMKSSGDKDGYFGSKVGASYIDNPESVYNSLEHYINARTHIFPPNIAVILKNASLDTDANFRSNNPRSCQE
jgi:hypothetical protein